MYKNYVKKVGLLDFVLRSYYNTLSTYDINILVGT